MLTRKHLCPYFVFYMICCFCCCCQAHNFKVPSVLVSHNSVSWSPFPIFLAAPLLLLFVLFLYLPMSFWFAPSRFFFLSEFVISLCSFIAVLVFMDLLRCFFFNIRLFCFTRCLVHFLRDSSVHMKYFPIPC